MGRVDLDNIEAGLDGTLGGLDPVLLQLLNVLKSQSLGDGVDGVLGDGRGSDDLVGPAADLLGGDGVGAQPRSDARRLAAGVCELDGNLLVLAVGKGGDALEGLDLAVLPETEVLGRDTTVGLHGGGLHDAQAGAALDDATQVCEVPVVGVAILGRVLAQRREEEAVLEGGATDGEGSEELGRAAELRARGRLLCGSEVRDAASGLDGDGFRRHFWIRCVLESNSKMNA